MGDGWESAGYDERTDAKHDVAKSRDVCKSIALPEMVKTGVRFQTACSIHVTIGTRLHFNCAVYEEQTI
jgi:hypothetical protein